MIIIGLGNPGMKYKKTYHNLGFMVIDALAENLDVKLKTKECGAVLGVFFKNGEKCVLAKPQTYMNLSGQSVKQLLAKYGKSEKELIVVYDDFSLPTGQIRIRKEGSAGGHNGMKSIISDIGTQNFMRIRIGIGDETVDPMNRVLARVKKDEKEEVDLAVQKAAAALEEIIDASGGGGIMDVIIAKYSK